MFFFFLKKNTMRLTTIRNESKWTIFVSGGLELLQRRSRHTFKYDTGQNEQYLLIVGLGCYRGNLDTPLSTAILLQLQ